MIGLHLGALKYNSEIHKSEIDNLIFKTAKISGAVKSIEIKTDNINIEVFKMSKSIQGLTSDLNVIEEVTGKNYIAIEKLKDM